MTMVPWSTLEPGAVEQIAAVLLGREHPRAIRQRPGRGDQGIDVLDYVDGSIVDVYQIKSFTTRLDRSRRGQIEESLRRVVTNGAVTIRDWYLVVPLQPTPGELQWFRDLDDEVQFTCHWFGVDRLDALAAAYQDVVDYYVDAGRQRLEETIRLLRDVARMDPADAKQLVTPEEASTRLRELYLALNRTDPHYRYELQVGQHPPRVSALLEEEGLVASGSLVGGDLAITHHIYARYHDATEDRPIPLTFSLRAGDMDDSVAEAWERAMRYGTPVTVPSPYVTDLRFGLPGGLEHHADEGTIRLGPAHPENAKPYRLRLQVVAPDDELLEEVVLDMAPVTRGIAHTGWRAHGWAPAQAFELEILCDLAEDGTVAGVRVGFRVGQLTGAAPAALRQPIRFLGQLRHPNRLRFAREFGPAVGRPEAVPSDESPASAGLVELIEALADLQEHVAPSLATPDIDALSIETVHYILRAARLLRGETLRDRWARESIHITLKPDAPVPTDDGPLQLAISGSLNLSIGHQRITVEPLTIVYLAAQPHVVDNGDGTIRMDIEPALGNTTRLMSLQHIDDVPPQDVAVDRESS